MNVEIFCSLNNSKSLCSSNILGDLSTEDAVVYKKKFNISLIGKKQLFENIWKTVSGGSFLLVINSRLSVDALRASTSSIINIVEDSV